MKDLVISTEKQPLITLDDIEVAQFTYMIIDNKKLKRIIDNVRMKGVLILGSFDQESKTILTLLKDVIRKHRYIPFLFNFEPPQTQEHMETVKTMALLSSFIIVDLSRRSGQVHELASLVKDTFIPFATIARHGTKVTAMQREFRNYFWYKHDYYSYCHKTAPRKIPKLFKNEILPWANRINKEIREKRTRSPQ